MMDMANSRERTPLYKSDSPALSAGRRMLMQITNRKREKELAESSPPNRHANEYCNAYTADKTARYFRTESDCAVPGSCPRPTRWLSRDISLEQREQSDSAVLSVRPSLESRETLFSGENIAPISTYAIGKPKI